MVIVITTIGNKATDKPVLNPNLFKRMFRAAINKITTMSTAESLGISNNRRGLLTSQPRRDQCRRADLIRLAGHPARSARSGVTGHGGYSAPRFAVPVDHLRLRTNMARALTALRHTLQRGDLEQRGRAHEAGRGGRAMKAGADKPRHSAGRKHSLGVGRERRDQNESAFSTILAAFVSRVPGARAAALVDCEGGRRGRLRRRRQPVRHARSGRPLANRARRNHRAAVDGRSEASHGPGSPQELSRVGLAGGVRPCSRVHPKGRLRRVCARPRGVRARSGRGGRLAVEREFEAVFVALRRRSLGRSPSPPGGSRPRTRPLGRNPRLRGRPWVVRGTSATSGANVARAPRHGLRSDVRLRGRRRLVYRRTAAGPAPAASGSSRQLRKTVDRKTSLSRVRRPDDRWRSTRPLSPQGSTRVTHLSPREKLGITSTRFCKAASSLWAWRPRETPGKSPRPRVAASTSAPELEGLGRHRELRKALA